MTFIFCMHMLLVMMRYFDMFQMLTNAQRVLVLTEERVMTVSVAMSADVRHDLLDTTVIDVRSVTSHHASVTCIDNNEY